MSGLKIIIAALLVLYLATVTIAILEPCINGYDCEKSWMKCSNLEHVGSKDQYNYDIAAPMGFVCLPIG